MEEDIQRGGEQVDLLLCSQPTDVADQPFAVGREFRAQGGTSAAGIEAGQIDSACPAVYAADPVPTQLFDSVPVGGKGAFGQAMDPPYPGPQWTLQGREAVSDREAGEVDDIRPELLQRRPKVRPGSESRKSA